MNAQTQNLTPTLNTIKSASQINSFYDSRYRLDWCYMRPEARPCFNFALVRELNNYYKALHSNNDSDMQYQVMASDSPGIFNLGGDLRLFKQLIETKNKAVLQDYAYACIETIYNKSTLHKKGVTHISLVQGDALGGGFEAALSADVFIAERSAKLGFPEVLFNWFPGMGAYPFLSRKIGPVNAEQVLLSGKVYSAEELHEMGVIDILVENGQGTREVYKYISEKDRVQNAWQIVKTNRSLCGNPITFEELKTITDHWVEKAMHLGKRDLRFMEKIVARQRFKLSSIAA